MQNLLSALANLIASVSVFTASSAKSAAVQTHALSLPQFGCKLMSFVTETRKNKISKLIISLIAHYQIFGNHVVMRHGNSVFSLTWSASMLIYWNNRKCLHKKRVQLPWNWFGTGFGGWGGGGVEVANAPQWGQVVHTKTLCWDRKKLCNCPTPEQHQNCIFK